MMTVFDKAKYHFERCRERGLPEQQAFVHTGLFVAWLGERGLLSGELTRRAARSIEALAKREMTGAEPRAGSRAFPTARS